MTGRRNPNPRTVILMPPPPPRTLTLTFILALVLPALSDELPPSPSPSPSHSSSSGLPPENARFDPAGIRFPPPPPTSSLPACPPAHPQCHHPHHNTLPLRHGWRLNFGQLMGIVLAGIAAALQVVLAAFLVYKRVQLTKAAG